MSLVELGTPYFPDPTTGRPVYNGYIYVGNPNTDPTVVGNQKTVTLRQEDGTEVATTQPVRTGAGGVPLYNGSPVQIIVNGDYSLTVQNSQETQLYYISSAIDINPSDVLNISGTYPTLSDLQAAATYTNAIAYVGGRTAVGDGGEGSFRWDPSDLSIEVAADTQQGVYVAPNSDFTGSSGAWVRQVDILRFEMFGAFPDGSDYSTEVQAAIDYGGVFDNLNQTFVAVGLSVTNSNVLIKNTIFDFGGTTSTIKYGIVLHPGADSIKFKNCYFQNIHGDGARNEAYAVAVDLDNVRNFLFDECTFQNISNQGDNLATNIGFTGGIFLRTLNGRTGETGVSEIPSGEKSQGYIQNCSFIDINTIFVGGATPAEKDLDNDADAIRTYSDFAIEQFEIFITNIFTYKVGKRSIKISNTGGLTINGVVCNGSDPADTEVPMESIIKVDNAMTHISNVKGYFGNYPCSDAIQIQDVTDTIIENVLVDDCNFIIGDTGATTNLQINNIAASVHGGLRLEQGGSRISIDNAHLLFDRTGRFPTGANRRGASFFNIEFLTIGNLYLKNGQMTFDSCNNLSFDLLKLEWTDTTDPSTTSMPDQIINFFGNNITAGKVLLNITDSLPTYIDPLARTGVVRIGGSYWQGGDFLIKSLNNPALQIRRSEKCNYGNFNIYSDENIHIGEGDTADTDITETMIGKIQLNNSPTRILLVRTLEDLIVEKVLKPVSDATNIFSGISNTSTNVYFERIYWPSPAALGAPAGVTVIDERTI